jgi:hypothetical protein
MSTTYYYRVRTVDLAAGISTNSSTITVTTTSQFAGGEGTSESPFQVATAEHLNNVRNFRSAHFIQTANISLSGYTTGTGWVSIGNFDTPFTGTYNGQNFIISNLTQSGDLSFHGLFGVVASAAALLRNIRLTEVALSSTGSNQGALAGWVHNSARVEGVSVAGTISGGSNNIGGLVGSLQSGAQISTSYSVASISGNNTVGGLVGVVSNATVRNVYSMATVTASNDAGGLFGYMVNSTWEYSYSAASVQGSISGMISGYMAIVDATENYYSNASGVVAFGSGSNEGAVARSPDELLLASTFSEWDFTTIWQIESGGKASYPFLRSAVQSPAPGYTATPRVPVPGAPLADATDVILLPEFSWGVALAANRYDLQVSRREDFAVLDVNQSNLTTASFTPASNLQRGQVYHWRVRSRSTVSNEVSDWSATHAFTTAMLVDPVPGYAMRFDGINDFATMPVVTNLSGDEITIEFWFKGPRPNSAVRHQYGSGYIVSPWGGSSPSSHILSNDGGTTNNLSSGFSDNGLWNHFAMTWKRNTANGFKSYLNGTLVAQRNSSDEPLPNIGSALILGSHDGLYEFTSGTLDEIRIWQVERSAAQIRENMHRVISTPQPGLRAFVNFKEGTGTTSDDGAVVLHQFDGTSASGWVPSTAPVGGSSASANAFVSGSTTLSGLTFVTTDAFDQASDLVVTRFDLAPAALPTLVDATAYTDAYWVTRIFGTPGTWEATLTFPLSSDFTENGAVPARRYRLYHRAAGSDGAWTEIASEASAVSGNSVSFSGITQTGQFLVALSEMVSLAEISTTELNFGSVLVNSRNDQSVTFTNSGDLPISVTSITVDGAGFSRVGAATASVAVGGTLSIPVRFQPAETGTLSGTLSIAHSASETSFTVQLTGEGQAIHPGQALSFTGQSGQYVYVADAAHPATYTIEMWFKPTVIEDMGLFVRTDNGGPSGGASHALRLNSNGQFEHYTFDGRPRPVYGTTIAQAGQWYHLAAVYRNNGDVALYVNGIQEAVGQANYQAPWAGGNAYWIGSTVGGHGMAKGEIDEVRFWFNVERTPAEVTSTMHQTLTTATGLRLNLRFDEATGDPVNRASAVTAVLMGAPPRVASGAPIQAPVMTAPSASLDFGVHTSAVEPTAAQLLSWSNTGSASMTVTRSSVGVPEGGSWFTVSPTALTIEPGQSANMEVRFAPTGNERRTESLRFDTNAEPVSVDLSTSGTGAILPGTWNTNPGTSLSASNNAQINIPYDADLNPGTFTLEFWVRPQSVSHAQTIIQSSLGSVGYRIGIQPDGRWIAWAGNMGGGVTLPGTNAVAGTWTHLALVIETGVTHFYVNGLYAAHSNEAFLPNTSAPFTIGDGEFFAGQIDELRLWSVARTEMQIQTWMHQPVTGAVNDLVFHLPFDEGSGVAVFDRAATSTRFALIEGSAAFSNDVPPTGSFIHGTEDGWYFLSNSAPGVTLAEFLEPLWTQGAVGSDVPGVGMTNVFSLNEAIGAYQPVTDLTVPAVPGKGYLVRVYKNDVYGTVGTFPKRLYVPRAEESATRSLAVQYTPGHAYSGFSLVGNPYAHTLDLSNTDWEFAGVSPTIYVYDQSINNYRTWNRSTGNASNDGSPYIAPMQGFLMLATGLEPSVLAPRSARASEAQRLLKETAVNADMVRLELQLTRGERQENMQVLIHADDRTVDVRDMTRQLEPLNSERFMIYGVDTKSGLKIESFEYSAQSETVIELPVHVEITSAGENTIGFVYSGKMDPSWGVVLVDVQTGVVTDLLSTPEYVFSEATMSAKSAGDDQAVGALLQTTSAEQARFRLLVGPGALDVATEELPTEVMLSQNYPNPFNPSTTIRFALPVPTEVRLDVFDLLGRQIVTLVNGAMPAGNHQVILNGANLSSGVYVYRIQAGGVVISRKLTLLK